jgi:hypothetical protein
MEKNFTDSSFFALNRVIDAIYRDEADIGFLVNPLFSLTIAT